MYSKRQFNCFKRFFYNRKNYRPFLRATSADKQYVYFTIYQCADSLEVSVEEIWDAFVQQTEVNGYFITPVLANDKESRAINIGQHVYRPPGSPASRPVNVFDIKENKTYTFPSMVQAGEFLAVSMANVRHRLTTAKKLSLVKRRYIVTDANDTSFLISPDIINKLLSRQGREVVLLDRVTRSIKRFEGLAQFTKKYHCRKNKAHIIYALKTYGVFCHLPDQFLIKEPASGRRSTDDELWRYLDEKVN